MNDAEVNRRLNLAHAVTEKALDRAERAEARVAELEELAVETVDAWMKARHHDDVVFERCICALEAALPADLLFKKTGLIRPEETDSVSGNPFAEAQAIASQVCASCRVCEHKRCAEGGCTCDCVQAVCARERGARNRPSEASPTDSLQASGEAAWDAFKSMAPTRTNEAKDPMGRNPCDGHGPNWSCSNCPDNPNPALVEARPAWLEPLIGAEECARRFLLAHPAPLESDITGLVRMVNFRAHEHAWRGAISACQDPDYAAHVGLKCSETAVRNRDVLAAVRKVVKLWDERDLRDPDRTGIVLNEIEDLLEKTEDQEKRR